MLTPADSERILAGHGAYSDATFLIEFVAIKTDRRGISVSVLILDRGRMILNNLGIKFDLSPPTKKQKIDFREHSPVRIHWNEADRIR